MLEVARMQPGFRRFQVTEKTKNNTPLIRDNPEKMLMLDVAITHLNAAQQEQALKQSLLVLAEIEDHVYSLTKSCAAIFAGTELAEREEVTEQIAQQHQPPISQGPDGWMA
jgi:hypothetical protein